MILLIYFIIICSSITVYLYKKYYRIFILSTKLSGPTAIPIFGNALVFFNKSPPEILKVLENLVHKYGNAMRLWFGFRLITLICDPKDAEIIVSSSQLITKAGEYNFIKPWLNEGLLLSTGRKWLSRRKAITPTFHFKILNGFVKIFNDQSDVFIKRLKQIKPTDKVDIFPMVTLYALDVICETAMGVRVNAQIDSNSSYVRAVKEIAGVIHKRIFDIFLRLDFIFHLSKYSTIQRNALKILHEFTERVIINRRNELVSPNLNETEIDEFGEKKKMGLLDVLLQANIDGSPLNNLDIREEVDTFMFEGHDTTTSAIAFALYEIARNKDVQLKLFDEINVVLGEDQTKPVTINDLNNLHYLDLVIKETLRLYPSVPMFMRRATTDIHLSDGKIIPVGTEVVIGPYFMGRDKNIFENPTAFIPERFDIEYNAEKFNPFAFIPFSAGPRNCIGQKFAVYEMKSILSKIVRNFELTLPINHQGPLELVAELILRPIDGIFLQVKQR